MPVTQAFLRAKEPETNMFGATDRYGRTPREPHTLPEALSWECTRVTEARLRRIEDAWAMHAIRANGFGAAEIYPAEDG